MRGSIAFIAGPYGFGPSSKAVAISSHLPRSIDRIFLGHGPALCMARNSNAFSSCLALDFGECCESIAQQLLSFDVIIFINTTRFIRAAATLGKSIILVETLAWLRDMPPPFSSVLSGYFAQRFFDHPFSPKLEALHNFTAVGAILPRNISGASGLRGRPSLGTKAPLVHCGGLFSPAMSKGADHEFVARAFDTVGALEQPIRAFLPSYLHQRFRSYASKGVEFLNCSPLTIHDQIIGSGFCLTTTGIEFTYESMVLGIPTLFLPAFNASQYYQLAYHRRVCRSSVPFEASEDLPALDFPSLHDLTTRLQDVGLSGVWSTQFAQIACFLERLRSDEKDELLYAVRDKQQKEMELIPTNGAQLVALHALQQVGLEATLE